MTSAQTITIRLISFCAILLLAGCLSSSEQADNSFADPPDPAPNPGPTNSPPVISGSGPTAVIVGQSYSFTPQASDPDGDTLAFAIQNKPSWADFDTVTGSLSGIPTMGDIGNYANIQITVSDGQLDSSTPSFAIDVTQVAIGSTTLSWTPPTLNDDGTSLTDLAGYKIYYGTSSGNYTNEIEIVNPSVTTFVVENLSPATYYFVATAFTTADVESQYSGELVKTIN